MIKRRFWSLKKGQIFRHDEWSSMLRKHGCIHFTFAYGAGEELLFNIFPWTKVWCEPPVDNPVTRIGDGWKPFVDAMNRADEKRKLERKD